MMSNPSNERRRYARAHSNFILSYHKEGNAIVKHDVSQLNNISKGGLSFTTTHQLALGVIVMVDLKTPFIIDAVHLEGVVLECREKIAHMLYEIRLQFHPVSPEALVVLSKIEGYEPFKEK